MAYRKLTIRRMKPVTREGARILNDLDGIRYRMSRRIHHAPPLTNILIYGNITVNGSACPKQEALSTLRRIVVAPEGRRSEALRKVQDSLLEQAEASKEDESMIPKSPQLTTHDMVSCVGEERPMILILPRTNLCPRSCKYFQLETGEESIVEYCHLPDGEWVLKVRQEQLMECPLGKWNLKAETGYGPLVF